MIFFLIIVFKTRKKNEVTLPEAGSGGALPSMDIAPGCSRLQQNPQGSGGGTARSNLECPCDLEEGPPCFSFLGSARAGGRLCLHDCC